MKKTITVIAVITMVTSIISAGEKYSNQADSLSQQKHISFTMPTSSPALRLLSDETGNNSDAAPALPPSGYYAKPKKSGKEIAGLVIGGIGAGGFGMFWFIHLVAGLAAPPIISAETGGILTKQPLCLAIMATSWIPVIGPFAAGAITLSMMDLNEYWFYGCEEVFGGIGAYCILEGLFEIAFLAMMISGFAFAGYQRHKSKTATALLSGKIMPIIGTTVTEDKTSNVFGVRVRI